MIRYQKTHMTNVSHWVSHINKCNNLHQCIVHNIITIYKDLHASAKSTDLLLANDSWSLNVPHISPTADIYVQMSNLNYYFCVRYYSSMYYICLLYQSTNIVMRISTSLMEIALYKSQFYYYIIVLLQLPAKVTHIKQC